MTAPLAVWAECDGQLLRIRLTRPKANVLDKEMVGALAAAFEEARADPHLKAVLLDAEGPHFSFGASVVEHLPDRCREMLTGFHALILEIARSPISVLVAVRGQCLGGGLEVALAAHRIFAAHDATFAQPEVKLGVFAPAASCLLPWRLGQGAVDDLLLSGRAVDPEEAARLGLVDETATDPEVAALAWFDAQLATLSASSLRFAVKAARAARVAALPEQLAHLERLYLEELMKTHDAEEGLQAFLEKRPARWEDR